MSETKLDIRGMRKILWEAVEKQIPKKPIFVDVRFLHHGRNISDGCSLSRCYKCHGCGTIFFMCSIPNLTAPIADRHWNGGMQNDRA